MRISSFVAASFALVISATSIEASAADTLASAIARAPAGSWVEYRAPLLDPERSPCCYAIRGGEPLARGCALDERNIHLRGADRDGHVYLGSPQALRVFLRIGGNGVDRVRTYGDDCPVETGSERVATLSNVAASDSLKFLEQLATTEGRSERDGAYVALAHHAGAVPVLRAIVKSNRPKAVRKEALFWLGQVGDDIAFEVFDDMLAEPNISAR